MEKVREHFVVSRGIVQTAQTVLERASRATRLLNAKAGFLEE